MYSGEQTGGHGELKEAHTGREQTEMHENSGEGTGSLLQREDAACLERKYAW